MTQEMFSDNAGIVAGREKKLVDALKAMLGIYVKVKLVNPKAITRSEGKGLVILTWVRPQEHFSWLKIQISLVR